MYIYIYTLDAFQYNQKYGIENGICLKSQNYFHISAKLVHKLVTLIAAYHIICCR